MNDPGFDEPINDHAKTIEEEEEDEEYEQIYLAPR